MALQGVFSTPPGRADGAESAAMEPESGANFAALDWSALCTAPKELLGANFAA